MGEILQEKYRFIQDDVFLVAHVNVKSGKQKLIMQKMNHKTGEVEFSDFIECIHTAIADISFDDYEEIHDDFFQQEEFQEKMLNIRSSEDVVEINLDPEEKFKALKSWIAGIAEAGKDAFKLESDIEMAGHLIYPIAGKLLQFMIKIDSDFVFEYLDKIDRECIFEGIRHEPSLIANLIPIFEMLYEDFMEPGIPNREEILKRIFDFKFSLDFISRDANSLSIVMKEHPEMTVQYLTETVKLALDQRSKREILKMAGPLCYLFREIRGLKLKDYDKEFVNTILNLNPSKAWLKRYNFSQYLKK